MAAQSFRDKVLANMHCGLEDLYSDQRLCDLKVTVGDQVFPCHSLVLATVSTFFHSLLMASCRDCCSKEVKIEHADVSAESFGLFLDILYKGKDVIVSVETAMNLLKMSLFLQVKFLEEHCEQFMNDNITSQSCLSLWMFADKYQLKKLAQKAAHVAMTRCPDICMNPEILKLSKGTLLIFLASQKILTMDSVCETILRWVEADAENRKEHLADLLTFVSFPHLSQKYLSSLMPYMMHPFRLIMFEGINEALTYNLDNKNHVVRRQILANQHAIVPSPCMRMRAVLVGGYTDPDKPEDKVVCVPLHQRGVQCSLKPVPETPGFHFATCRWKNEIHISGGTNNPTFFAKYKPGFEEWEILPSMPREREGHTMAAVSGNIYVIGGLNKIARASPTKEERPPVGETMVYSTRTKTWMIRAHMSWSTVNAASAVLGHRIYIFGGLLEGEQPTDMVKCIDTLHNCLYHAGWLPVPASGARAVSDGGTIHVVTSAGLVLRMREDSALADKVEQQFAEEKGKHDGAGEADDKKDTTPNDLFSTTVTFQEIAKLQRRSQFGCFLDKDELVVCGGFDNSPNLSNDIVRVHLETGKVTQRKKWLSSGMAGFHAHMVQMPEDFLPSEKMCDQPFPVGSLVKPKPSLPADYFPSVVDLQGAKVQMIHHQQLGTVKKIQANGHLVIDFPGYDDWICPPDYVMLASAEDACNANSSECRCYCPKSDADETPAS